MLNRITFIFLFFFYFSRESWGSQRVPHSAAVSLLLRWFPFFFLSHVSFFFLIWVVVFTSSERITVEPAPFVSVLPSEGLFSHVFFSALCFFPLKHAPLILSEEDQAG